MRWYEKEKKKENMEWIKKIPIPPQKLEFQTKERMALPLEIGYASDRLYTEPILPKGWSWDSDFSMHVLGYHPNAAYGIRSDPAANGSGAQAMYDKRGKLITGGVSAGSADKVSPDIGKWRHRKEDVDPFNEAAALDAYYGGTKYRLKYLEVRPPNTGDAPPNPVD